MKYKSFKEHMKKNITLYAVGFTSVALVLTATNYARSLDLKDILLDGLSDVLIKKDDSDLEKGAKRAVPQIFLGKEKDYGKSFGDGLADAWIEEDDNDVEKFGKRTVPQFLLREKEDNTGEIIGDGMAEMWIEKDDNDGEKFGKRVLSEWLFGELFDD